MIKLIKKIAITTGDVNGIGTEITIKALNQIDLPVENVVLVSNSSVLNYYGKLKKDYEIIEIPYERKFISPGKLMKESGEFCFRSLKVACEMAKQNLINGIVTAPVSKEALHMAGHIFNGQTEVLQEFLARDGQSAEMLFVARNFRVLLLTRHVPLKEIVLNKKHIVEQIVNLDKFFTVNLGFKPKFALCSFNPHAGEGGILGREEIDILNPAVDILRAGGINITSPLPADTLFVDAADAYLKNEKPPYDCYIATYHDQGLIPIKTVASKNTVNMTIGLDVLRTSPSHGTAFDIAGKNLASESSMIEAISQVLYL